MVMCWLCMTFFWPSREKYGCFVNGNSQKVALSQGTSAVRATLCVCFSCFCCRLLTFCKTTTTFFPKTYTIRWSWYGSKKLSADNKCCTDRQRGIGIPTVYNLRSAFKFRATFQFCIGGKHVEDLEPDCTLLCFHFVFHCCRLCNYISWKWYIYCIHLYVPWKRGLSIGPGQIWHIAHK